MVISSGGGRGTDKKKSTKLGSCESGHCSPTVGCFSHFYYAAKYLNKSVMEKIPPQICEKYNITELLTIMRFVPLIFLVLRSSPAPGLSSQSQQARTAGLCLPQGNPGH